MDTNVRLLVEKLNLTCRKALERAAEICVKQSHYAVDIEHYLLALLEMQNNDLELMLSTFNITKADVKRDVMYSMSKLKSGNTRTPSVSNHLVDIFAEARKQALEQTGSETIRSGMILMALYNNDALRKLMIEVSASMAFVTREFLKSEIKNIIKNSFEDRDDAPQSGDDAGVQSDGSAGSQMGAPRGAANGKALDAYTQDLTAQAKSGALDPIFGRDAEIRQVIDILTRRRQNNPILTGEPGVGKTAVVEGLAQKIIKGDVPPMLRDVSLRSLDLGLLQAGASMKGEFENRLKQVIQEVKQSPKPVILFIDEAHTMIGAGGSAGQGDAANLLKPALARGELRTVAATTWAEYKNYFEKDPALTRRFQVVKVEEPVVGSAIDMVRGTVEKFAHHHKVRILDEAVQQAVKLTHRYIPERKLPDKAMSVLDTACAKVAITQASTPASLEALSSEKEYLERELATLSKEHATTPIHSDRITAIKERLTGNSEETVALQARWTNELELVKAIDAKATEVEKATAENAENTQTLLDELTTMREELKQVQTDSPLVLPFVDGYTVASVISGWTGIPIGKMLADNVDAIQNLDDAMASRVKGQPQAIEAIGKRMRTSIAGLSDPNKPTAVFLLVGPSGVGKTETALTLADMFFGGDRNITTIAMSEYQEAHTVSLLKGAPPGYVGYGKGGVLTEAVRRNPYSVVL
ncbi:MAG: type VI secretion system ATPase TssH, partial [Candidatus Kapabacteria bacterium]|nr:type VI secretion system ATPase TssH [Candidatus Kapabacteria bacterium]